MEKDRDSEQKDNWRGVQANHQVQVIPNAKSQLVQKYRKLGFRINTKHIPASFLFRLRLNWGWWTSQRTNSESKKWFLQLWFRRVPSLLHLGVRERSQMTSDIRGGEGVRPKSDIINCPKGYCVREIQTGSRKKMCESCPCVCVCVCLSGWCALLHNVGS